MFKITILGSWDTLWTPIVWCKCKTCTDKNLKSKRCRFGMLIEHEDTKILVDTNPDLKQQCLDNNFELKEIDHILLTHTHTDHTNWMWEFFYKRENPTILHYLKHSLIEKHLEYFRYLERENVLNFESFENEKSFSIKNIKITPIELDHWFPCSGFIIEVKNKKISIISDTSINIPEKSKKLIQNSDIVFADSFTENYEQIKETYNRCNITIPLDLKENWFHMTVEEVKKLQSEINAKRIYTIHMSSDVSCHDELVEKHETSDFIIGYDWLEIIC